MTLLDFIGGTFIGTAAAAMALATLGPYYFLFKVLPDLNSAARHAHFVQTLRAKRKERYRLRKQEQQSIKQSP